MGTVVALHSVWRDYTNDDGVDDSLNRILPWTALVLACDLPLKVWCVED
jgi:hypothetical protein